MNHEGPLSYFTTRKVNEHPLYNAFSNMISSDRLSQETWKVKCRKQVIVFRQGYAQCKAASIRADSSFCCPNGAEPAFPP